MFTREGVVEPVAKYAVIELPVSEAITPPTALNEVRRLIDALHAAGDSGICVAQENFSCAVETIACAPEPHTRFTVIAGTVTGRPACTAA